MGKLVQVFDDWSISPGAFAANDVLTTGGKIDSGRTSGFRAVKGRFMCQYSGKTEGDGPAVWGIACNLTAAEVELILEDDPQSPFTPREGAPASYIKILGVIAENSPGMSAAGDGSKSGSGHDGAPWVEETINWSIPEEAGLVYFVWNHTSAAWTTGSTILGQSQIMGVWLDD